MISETSTFLILKTREKNGTQNLCKSCAKEVVWLKPKRAAELTGLSPRAIYRLLETGLVHSTETTSDEPEICLLSLMKNYQKRM